MVGIARSTRKNTIAHASAQHSHITVMTGDPLSGTYMYQTFRRGVIGLSLYAKHFAR